MLINRNISDLLFALNLGLYVDSSEFLALDEENGY